MGAREVARQLRLRDMGGIIVVDFIDMRNPQHKRELFEALKTEMAKDRAQHTILPPSRFGLVQITRERVRPETQITTSEKCPTCDGTGQIKASILLVDEIENHIRYFAKEQNEKSVILHVHPYIEAYINRGIYSLKWQWYFKYKISVKVNPVLSYHFSEYHFLNKKGEEIKI
jgi:ribonuclease G